MYIAKHFLLQPLQVHRISAICVVDAPASGPRKRSFYRKLSGRDNPQSLSVSFTGISKVPACLREYSCSKIALDRVEELNSCQLACEFRSRIEATVPIVGRLWPSPSVSTTVVYTLLARRRSAPFHERAVLTLARRPSLTVCSALCFASMHLGNTSHCLAHTSIFLRLANALCGSVARTAIEHRSVLVTWGHPRRW